MTGALPRIGSRASRATTGGGVLFAVFQNGSRANGGVESVTQVIEGLREQPRLVLTNAETPTTARWRKSNAETVVWKLPLSGLSWRKGGLFGMARRLWDLLATNWWTWRTLRARQLDAVHCNDPAPYWHVAVGAKLAGVPLLWNLRDTKSQEEGLDVPRYRRRFRWCSQVLVLSREMQRFYGQASLPRRGGIHPPIEFIYSVVDFERMKPLPDAERAALRRRLGIPENTFAVGFIATFNDKKNQLDYLRHAVPLLAKSHPPIQTFFVGDFNPAGDSYARACADAAREERIEEQVRFAGFCGEVEQWYQACDAVVIPTRKEGLARCMIEALACGTPVVSFDVASAREILEEHQCGRVVAQGDYQALCRELIGLANSPALRSELAVNGVAIAERLFSADRCLEKYRNLILTLTDK